MTTMHCFLLVAFGISNMVYSDDTDETHAEFHNELHTIYADHQKPSRRGSGIHWTHDEGPLGPTHWVDYYSDCGDMYQSPVNLQPQPPGGRQSPMTEPERVSWIGYGDQYAWTNMTNTGHAIQLTTHWTNNQRPYMTLPRVGNQRFIFQQMHLHWGKDDENGSEHMIEGVQYDMEMHFVHYNSRYESFDEAARRQSPLVVVAILVKIKEENPAFNEITANIYKVMFPEESYMLRDTMLLDFLPPISGNYYIYIGSLTTPPCSGQVMWVVYNEPISIGERQIDAFRKVQGTHGTMAGNVRSIQKLNDREVIYVPN